MNYEEVVEDGRIGFVRNVNRDDSNYKLGCESCFADDGHPPSTYIILS